MNTFANMKKVCSMFGWKSVPHALVFQEYQLICKCPPSISHVSDSMG